jgi:hypothetical protein
MLPELFIEVSEEVVEVLSDEVVLSPELQATAKSNALP